MPFKYIGEGRFVAGVPARDLSDAEVAALPGLAEQIAAGAADEGPTPVYRRMTRPEEREWRAEQVAEAQRHAEAAEAKRARREGREPAPVTAEAPEAAGDGSAEQEG
jgi:hypothetical protein